jgi:pimeloyl-ACP methyl ester carboxylesterase
MTRISCLDAPRAVFSFRDPKTFLFFTRTANGKRSAKEFLAPLEERTKKPDKAMSLFGCRAQLKAIHRWGRQEPVDLAAIEQPVLVVNGDQDRMVPTTNMVDLARRLPNSELVVYPTPGAVASSSAPGIQRDRPRVPRSVARIRNEPDQGCVFGHSV